MVCEFQSTIKICASLRIPVGCVNCLLICVLIGYIEPVTCSTGRIKPDKAHPAAKIQILRRRFVVILIKTAAIGHDETLGGLLSRIHPALRRSYFIRFLIIEGAVFIVII